MVWKALGTSGKQGSHFEGGLDSFSSDLLGEESSSGEIVSNDKEDDDGTSF